MNDETLPFEKVRGGSPLGGGGRARRWGKWQVSPLRRRVVSQNLYRGRSHKKRGTVSEGGLVWIKNRRDRGVPGICGTIKARGMRGIAMSKRERGGSELPLDGRTHSCQRRRKDGGTVSAKTLAGVQTTGESFKREVAARSRKKKQNAVLITTIVGKKTDWNDGLKGERKNETNNDPGYARMAQRKKRNLSATRKNLKTDNASDERKGGGRSINRVKKLRHKH